MAKKYTTSTVANVSHEIQIHYVTQCKQTPDKRSTTKVELAVDFLTVDDVELVWKPGLHVAHFEVEPLVMMISVDVTVQYQIVLVLTNLCTKDTSSRFYLYRKMSLEY